MKEALLKERYEADYERISQELFQGKDPGCILTVSMTGDKHLHGEAVTEVHTSGGLRLFYKPRDCQSTNLCGDLTQLLFEERMVPEQVAGDGYAFQKAAEHKLPDTETGKRAYYEKLGRLTALFYALGSTDMHKGNILCENTCPVVIDTETLLYAKAEGFAGNGEFSLDYGEIFPDYQTNVGESMVLPRFYKYMQTTPLLPEKNFRPEGYESCFTDGFREGYCKICENREEIIRILETYQDAPFRIVLRSTQYYAVKAEQYKFADTDAKKEEVLKSLEKGLSAKDLARWARILSWEKDCILEDDVPYFCFLAGGRELYGAMDSPALITDFLEDSPIGYARWRMMRMCEQDLKVQTAYIKASLKHMDEWELPKKAETKNVAEAEIQQAQEQEQEQGQGQERAILSIQEAVEEVEEALRTLWEERIPLSGGCCLWHTPMITGTIGSLFGLAEGFSGAAVFIHACVRSPLLTGEAAKIAKELHAACFQNLVSFGEYLLKAYPEPPEERIISRRFNGDFSFSNGLSGYVWALKQFRQEDPERTDRILEGFRHWHLEDAGAGLYAILKCIREGTLTDGLEYGRAAKAAALLLQRVSGKKQTEAVQEAGAILKRMVSRKRMRGCYQVFQEVRRSYFLPAFLRGSTGIAWVLLLYSTIRQH